MSRENDAEALISIVQTKCPATDIFPASLTHIEKYMSLSHMLAIFYAQNQTDNQQQQQQKCTNLWKL